MVNRKMIREQCINKGASVPPIDLKIPEKVETATFALG